MIVHSDDRRTFIGNLFDTTEGDVNLVELQPGAVCAWHRHQQQDDQLFCVSGAVKVGITKGTSDPVTWEVLTARHPRVLTIPRGLWHGYQNIGDGCAVLVGFNNQKYNPEDEERMLVSAMNHVWARSPR